MIAATQLKVGMIIMHNGKPHRVSNAIHRTPGNLRGFVQARLALTDLRDLAPAVARCRLPSLADTRIRAARLAAAGCWQMMCAVAPRHA